MKSVKNPVSFICLKRTIFVVLVSFQFPNGNQSENFEFHLSNAMLISSLRIFDQVSDQLFISKAKNGSVILKADPGHGIMVVVQEINLQNIQYPQNSCLDYIKLSQVEGTLETSQICGNLESSSNSAIYASEQQQQQPLLPRPTFLDTSGFLELDYVLSEKTRLSPLEPNITNFNLSFTPFMPCPEDAFPFGNSHLRPCSLLDTFSCISADFWCDGVINCAFPGTEFGLDEQNCDAPKVQDSNRNDETQEKTVIVSKKTENASKIPEMETRLDFILWKYTKRANVGLFCSLLIFGLLWGLLKMRRDRERNTIMMRNIRSMILDNGRNDGKSGSSCSVTQQCYDVDWDPVPSYEDCLLNYEDYQEYSSEDRPVYCVLSIEAETTEQRPPSYEEVRVHRNNSNNISTYRI